MLPLNTYLAALRNTNAVKGISPLQLTSDLNLHYKTVFVLAQKLRESQMANQAVLLDGEIYEETSGVGAV